jgi:hypothetical protein
MPHPTRLSASACLIAALATSPAASGSGNVFPNGTFDSPSALAGWGFDPGSYDPSQTVSLEWSNADRSFACEAYGSLRATNVDGAHFSTSATLLSPCIPVSASAVRLSTYYRISSVGYVPTLRTSLRFYSDAACSLLVQQTDSVLATQGVWSQTSVGPAPRPATAGFVRASFEIAGIGSGSSGDLVSFDLDDVVLADANLAFADGFECGGR